MYYDKNPKQSVIRFAILSMLLLYEKETAFKFHKL